MFDWYALKLWIYLDQIYFMSEGVEIGRGMGGDEGFGAVAGQMSNPT
jgi:hypothetical protein